MLYIGRTDIASEALRQKDNPGAIEGVISREEKISGLNVFSVEILNSAGSAALGRPEGKYFTLELPAHYERGSEQFADTAGLLSELISRCCIKKNSVLIAALGNPDITPDALGNLAAGSILITRHLKESRVEGFEGFASVALSRPGVLGSSGVESAMQISWMCERLKPELVIVIDAMAGADGDNLCRCIQVSDTGLAPGSGVGNDRQAFSREFLGVPVLAIGMPTVVDAGCFGDESLRGMFVTPKDIDSQVRAAGRLIGYGINLALHSGLTVSDIDMLIS